MKLNVRHIVHGGTRSIGHRQPVSRRHIRVGGLLPQTTDTARSQHDGIGLEGDDGLRVLVKAPYAGDALLRVAVMALDQVDGCQVIAVGQKTRDTLVSAGIEAQIPERADSEGLLQMPALEAVERNDVLIVKGEGGRDLLGKELTARGARVVEWSCYRRVWPDVSLTALDAFAHHALVFQASSGEVLSRLSELLAGAGKRDLFQSTVIVPSERVAALAERSGWRSVVRADDASDRGFLQALQSLRSPA